MPEILEEPIAAVEQQSAEVTEDIEAINISAAETPVEEAVVAFHDPIADVIESVEIPVAAETTAEVLEIEHPAEGHVDAGAEGAEVVELQSAPELTVFADQVADVVEVAEPVAELEAPVIELAGESEGLAVAESVADGPQAEEPIADVVDIAGDAEAAAVAEVDEVAETIHVEPVAELEEPVAEPAHAVDFVATPEAADEHPEIHEESAPAHEAYAVAE